MEIPYVENRDGDTVREAYQRRNSDMESVENSNNSMTEWEASGSRVGPEAQN